METAETILNLVKSRMILLEAALSDVRSTSPDRRRVGFANVAILGRSITFILQNLRRVNSNFDSWYSPYVEQMRGDELCRFFLQLRNEIEKEGRDGIAVTVQVNNISRERFIAMHPPPENWRSAFIGDHNGGAGYVIDNRDGTETKIYVELSPDVAVASLEFTTSPETHLGAELRDKSLSELCRLYVSYLRRLVNDAIVTFPKLRVE